MNMQKLFLEVISQLSIIVWPTMISDLLYLSSLISIFSCKPTYTNLFVAYTQKIKKSTKHHYFYWYDKTLSCNSWEQIWKWKFYQECPSKIISRSISKHFMGKNYATSQFFFHLRYNHWTAVCNRGYSRERQEVKSKHLHFNEHNKHIL